MNKKKRLSYYCAYVVLFTLLAGLIVFFYYAQGKSMIEAQGDGFRQHFRALLYYSEYLKNIFGSFFSSGKLVIPQWDFVIGEGSDILKSLHYYCIGDIFTFFCFLFPKEKMYIYYDLATILRMFCSGIAFSELCFYKQKRNYFIILAASLIYAFCPLSLANLGSHVFFLSTVFYFPLIILGVEKIINGDKPYLLSISVCLSSLSNIYFFYMNVVSTIVFTLVRIVLIKEDIRERAKIIFRITVYSFIGVLMSGMIFLPMFYSMISNTRLSSTTVSDVFYSLSYYVDSYIGLSFNSYCFFGGFTLLGIISLVHLYIQKKNSTLQTLFLLSIVFVAFPFFGKLYNAMVYPTDRWLYAVSLLVSYIIVEVFDEKDSLEEVSWTEIVIILLYYVSCVVIDTENRKIHVMFLLMIIVMFALLKKIKKQMLFNLVCLGAGVFCVLFDILYNYSPLFWYRAQGGLDITEIAKIDAEEHSVFNEIDDDTFYRYSGNNLKTNESVQGKKSSTQYYWSVVNDYVVDFRKELGISDNSNHHQNNYDDRFMLNALSDVKYYIRSANPVPYGFDYLRQIKGYDIYRSVYNLPLAYEYDSYITRDEWDKLDLQNKNETLLQTAVVSDEINFVKNDKLQFENTGIDCTISSGDGIEISDKQITISKEYSDIMVSCKSDLAGEYYFMVEGLESDESAYIIVSYQNVSKYIKFKGNRSLHYSDRHDYLVNLGYMEGIDGEVTVTFPISGTFDYSDIKIICQPLRDQISYAEKLRNVKINDLIMDPNVIKADVEINKDGLLCLAIPYAKGWKVSVDGKQEQLLNCNIQYMGLLVNQGRHEIELRYSTPLFNEGIAVSISGFIALCLTIVIRKRNEKKIGV